MKKIIFDYNTVFDMAYFVNLNIYNAKSIRMYGKWNKKFQRNETMLAMVEKMRSRTNVFIDVCETKFTMMILKRKAVASPYIVESN